MSICRAAASRGTVELMSRSRVLATPVIPAAVLVGAMALSACSASSKTAASTTSAPSSTSTSSAPSSSGPDSTSPSSSSTTSSSTSPTSTAPTLNLELGKSCLIATAKVAAATIRWNASLKTQKSSLISSAAKNYRSTASDIRKTTKSAADKTYTSYVDAVAGDMETMAAQSNAGKATVSGTALTKDSKKLTSYCQRKTIS